ncbi:type II toxin-antitoxin system RelE/ParE family toxin [Marinomonas colpomeniae]|uniref:Type II toxin-antitoxin system RelE/ParE family toxin n=1 Tax=Marinomonas colpomeniae TaxID=2774408 RepID=A0ABR8NW68_9GAMM|nr:type II toxin-antitoxin system RelE/ParE family toxin [Marinomonas colpomeniae]MBD5770294.1 type II toxin-antitoxin system RelE/ParE family toxin [Marinomonas colpomeniae]
MSYQVRIRPKVEDDLKEAYSYFEQCKIGLGTDFIQCIEASLSKISDNPKQYPVIHKTLHRALVNKFPYSIFYKIHEDIIIIFAVMHCAREPKKWILRV